MFYRIKVDLAFDQQGFPVGIMNHILGVFAHAKTINPGEDYEERGFLIFEECHHDETPPGPCGLIEEHHTPV